MDFSKEKTELEGKVKNLQMQLQQLQQTQAQILIELTKAQGALELIEKMTKEEKKNEVS